MTTKNKRRNRVQQTCYCEAYCFPHRLGSGNCDNRKTAEDQVVGDHSEYAEERRLFDRDMARYINSQNR